MPDRSAIPIELLRSVPAGGDDTPEMQAFRARLIAGIVAELGEMASHTVQHVARFVDICRNDHGCDTPAEQFIVRLVRAHALRGLKPEDVNDDLEEFKEDFADSVRITRRFNRIYPDAVREEAPNGE